MFSEGRILRGGSWFDHPQDCRSAYRSRLRPVGSYNFVGFRVVCLPQPALSLMNILRLLRGGSWDGLPGSCRSAYRFRDPPDFRNLDVGFRVVCLPQPATGFMTQILRVLRGGAWDVYPVGCRSAFCNFNYPDNAFDVIGFRVVCLSHSATGFMTRILRVLRGGSWLNLPGDCRSAFRNDGHPACDDGVIGFRVCCLPQPALSLMTRILRAIRGGSWFDLPQDCRSACRIRKHPVHSFDDVGFRVTGVTRQTPSIDMVEIPAGTFLMGSPASEEGHCLRERPQHEVTLERFFMSRTPITQAQWVAVMGNNPSEFKGSNLPVESVSWHDAMKFCDRLSKLTGRTYTLPTEAQWEYACRAGTTTPFSFGETITTDQANYDGNYTYGNGQEGEYRRHTTDVGTFPPNAWGLHDMHGNVWEWCLDEWHDSYAGAPTDGSAWEGGDNG